MFLPYKNNNPEYCDRHGYRYSMSNCVFEAAFEVRVEFRKLGKKAKTH